MKFFSTDAYGRSTEPEEEQEYSWENIRKRSYQKQFAGYTVRTVLGADGKPVTVRVYTGPLFRPSLSDTQRRGLKFLYSALMVSAVIAVIAALCLPVPSNNAVAAFAPACLSLGLYLWLGFALLAFLPAGPELKLHEYDDGVLLLRRFAIPVGCSPLLTVIITAIFLILRTDSILSLEYLRLLLLCLSGAAVAAVGLRERRIQYTVIPSDKPSSPTPAPDSES